MNSKQRKLNVGDDSVVIGQVTGTVGDGSVVIGPSDDHGNVILNQAMAVGRGAFAGPDSIAVGAGAGAGSQAQLPYLVHQLAEAVKTTGDDTIAVQFYELVAELGKDRPDTQRATSILQVLRNAAALSGAWSLLDRIARFIPNT